MIDFTQELTSLAAIVVLSVFFTGAVKEFLGRASVLADIPTWIYTAFIAILLTWVAASVFQTLPVPEGGLFTLILNGALNGAIASGAREWFKHRGTTLGESSEKRKDEIGL